MATQDGFQPYPLGLTALEAKEAIEKAHNLDAAEIRILVNAASDSHVFTNDDHTKLNDIENDATADQTAAEIRALVESATDSHVFTNDDHTKLNDIELNATADQTAAEIRVLVESATDSHVFTNDDHTKLNDIENDATADQTDAEIRTAVESASDSHVFTDDDHTKLNDIELNATADQTSSQIRALIQNNTTFTGTSSFYDISVSNDLDVDGNITLSGTVNNRNIVTDGTKLDTVEEYAKNDQTAAEIRALVNAASDSHVFTNDDHTKLNNIENDATADQTAAEIRALVNAASDSHVFTDDDHTKLGTIESNAKNDQTSSEIRALMAASPSFTGLVTMQQLTASGTTRISGRVFIENSNDVTSGSNTGALIIGSDGTTPHIAIDQNEIMAKTDNDSHATLNLNLEGGLVVLGGGLDARSYVDVNSNISVGGTGTFGGEVTISKNTSSGVVYNNGHLELISNNGSDVSMGFHRGTQTACQLRHSSSGLILSGTTRTATADFEVTGSITSGGPVNSNVKLNTKVINIGSWDMRTNYRSVSHGLNSSKIRSVEVMIQVDTPGTSIYPMTASDSSGNSDGSITIFTTNIGLLARPGGLFDSTIFNSTSSPSNRGWITIQYTD